MIQSLDEGSEPAEPLKSSAQTSDQPEGVDGTEAEALVAVGIVRPAAATTAAAATAILRRTRDGNEVITAPGGEGRPSEESALRRNENTLPYLLSINRTTRLGWR